VLSKQDFDAIVRDRGGLALVSAIVARRAVALTNRAPVRRRTIVAGVVAEPGVRGASLVAGAVDALARTTLGRRCALVRVAADDDLAIAVARARTLHAGEHLVVVDLPSGTTVEHATALCDTVVLVTTDGTRTHEGALVVVNRHRATGPSPSINRCDPFVLPDDEVLTRLDRDLAVAAILGGRAPGVRIPIERLVRKLFGVTVGVAFGGGAAFGIAHIGVLQALERAGIVPDLFAGTSFGAIVALGAAGGLSGDDMAEIARQRGNVRTTLSVLDPAFDGTGLLAGRRLIRIFAPMLAHERFDQLGRPCRVVATDIDSGERVELGDGRIDEAFRASCSIPLIFSPVVTGGRTLVDGAMVDPVPAEVVRAMGADIVIGVNVVPRLEPGSTTAISRTFKRINRFNPLAFRAGARGLPDIVDVLMNSLQVVQRELGAFRSLAGDVHVDVDLAGFTWIEFYRAMEIVERGRIAGEAAVAQLAAEIERRLGDDDQPTLAASSSSSAAGTRAARASTSGSRSGQARKPIPTRSR
jgi:NTE family protein